MITDHHTTSTVFEESEQEKDPQEWFRNRAWAISGNLVGTDTEDIASLTTKTKRIVFPSTTAEVASIVQATSYSRTPIAVVGGGNEASNSPILASSDAILLDLQKNMKSITINHDQKTITVMAGDIMYDLAVAVRNAKCALPLGTGPNIGVIGFTINGGLSGYFSRRMGLLAQRVIQFTMVDAEGRTHILNRRDNDDRFTGVLGAGSAFGIVTEMTFQMEEETILKSADQYVFVAKETATLVHFTHWMLRYVRDRILPNVHVAAEIVTTAEKASVVTLVFYDTFDGTPSEYWSPIMNHSNELGLLNVSETHWETWFGVTGAAWPIISELKGSPLALIQHCCGTVKAPTDSELDFISNKWIDQGLLQSNAEHSIVEARTLGGACWTLPSVPTGNCVQEFFVNIIAMYDAGKKTVQERQTIADHVSQVVTKARCVDSLVVDFSGTHSQLDDWNHPVQSCDIFGTPELAELVLSTKHAMDPYNRFRFHPFATCLTAAEVCDGFSTSSS